MATAQTQTQAYNSDQFSSSIVQDIERAKAGLAEWDNLAAQTRGEGAADMASERVQQGQYDEALANLQIVAT